MELYAIRNKQTGLILQVSYDQNTPFYKNKVGAEKALMYHCKPTMGHFEKDDIKNIVIERMKKYEIVTFNIVEVKE